MPVPSPPNRRTAVLRSVRGAVSLHRRAVAAGLAAAAAAAGLHAVSPPPAQSVPVLVAARDLTGGERMSAADVRAVRLPPAAVPRSALTSASQALGRVIAAPVREGSPLTDVSLVGRSLVAGYGPGMVAAPVRIADAGAVSLVGVGDRVDVLAASADGAPAIVASAAPVVAVPAADASAGSESSGALVVLAVDSTSASELAQAAVSAQLSLVLHG